MYGVSFGFQVRRMMMLYITSDITEHRVANHTMAMVIKSYLIDELDGTIF